jgi:hypothetical protein
MVADRNGRPTRADEAGRGIPVPTAYLIRTYADGMEPGTIEERSRLAHGIGLAGSALAGMIAAALAAGWLYVLAASEDGWASSPLTAITVVVLAWLTLLVSVVWLTTRRRFGWRAATAAWLVAAVLAVGLWASWEWVNRYEARVGKFEAAPTTGG